MDQTDIPSQSNEKFYIVGFERLIAQTSFKTYDIKLI